MFVDDDFLWTGDIAELLNEIDESKALMCVQHDYRPTVSTKLAGRQQSIYPRKNWSSMVLYNCGHPVNQKVTLSLVNSQSGAYLHRFTWIQDDNLIGKVPYTWNFLVDWYDVLPKDGLLKLPQAIHYTEGGPWFPDYRDTDYAAEWFEYMREYENTLPAPRLLCPYELFSCKGVPPLEGYENSGDRWEWGSE